MRKLILAALLATVGSFPAAMPGAEAQGQAQGQVQGGWHHRDRYHSGMYDRYGRYREPHRLGRNDRIWRGRDGRYYCRRDNGTTGLIIGGAIGALLGREIDGGRERTLGTILGAAGGGLLGREIDRGNLRCR